MFLTNAYEDNNGNLASSTYGNGDNVNYTYDSRDRVIATEYKNSSSVRQSYYGFAYDWQNRLARVANYTEGYTTYYTYDLSGRLIEKNRSDGAYVKTAYNEKNQTTGVTYSFGGLTESASYDYNLDKDNALSKTTFSDCSYTEITYDALGRTSKETLFNAGESKIAGYEYTYLDQESSSSKTSGLVSEIDYTGAALYDIRYEYDSRGNIKYIIYNDIYYDKFTYDSLNRLIRVDAESTGQTVVYTYDNSGNIQTKNIYTCTYVDQSLSSKTLLDSITYTYGNSYRPDLLTKYNGTTITYDDIYNPLTYGSNTFTWNGRRMTSYSDGTTTTTYKYNEDGVRTSKTVGSTETEFLVDGTTVLAQKTGSTTIPFFYDGNGKRIAFKYNGVMYYYVYNLQGDVTHILTSASNIVGTYKYDAWGNITNLDELTDIAKVNPFRYRGYYYDSESNLYYLNSRYYNPEWGRFLNADGYVTTGQGLTSYNLFTYCGNNPVNYSDPSGCACICLTQRVISSRHVCSDNEPSIGPGEAMSYLADFSSMMVDATFEYAKQLYENSFSPNNIGTGTYKKYVASQIASLTKESKFISKIFNAISYICVVITAGEEAYDNYTNGKSTGKIIWDFTVETSISSVCVYYATSIGSIAGAAIGNPIIGAIGGSLVGIILGGILTNLTEDPKKMIKGWVK